MEPSELVVVSALVAAAAASITVIATIAYVYYTARMLWVQLDPKVVLYVKHDENRPTALTLVIENIGRGVAYDVKFKPARSIPHRAFGMNAGTLRPPVEMTDGPIVRGIPALAPGDKRVVTWGQYHGLKKALGGAPIDVAISYQSDRGRHKGFAQLEVDSYALTDAAESPNAATIRYLRGIKDALERMASTQGAGPALIAPVEQDQLGED